MGLFLGTDHGYELDRAATRVEGVVMLIRMLGEEEAALAYTGAQPFRDVPEWASKYVAYAYGMGYTKGRLRNVICAQHGNRRRAVPDVPPARPRI